MSGKHYATMSTIETSETSLSVAEAKLGAALVLLQRALPRLDEPGRAAQVQSDLRQAGACIEAARLAHEKDLAKRGLAQSAAVDSETAAIIAAAIAALLAGPHRLVSVRRAEPPTPHLNVWALEGRTQIFHSHKVR
jgi:hypothetical protein